MLLTSMTLLGQVLMLHVIVMIVLSVWFAKRVGRFKTNTVLLLGFGWLIPILGPLVVLSYLLGVSGKTKPPAKPPGSPPH